MYLIELTWAEGVRFELTRAFRPYRISSAAHSAALAPLHSSKLSPN